MLTTLYLELLLHILDHSLTVQTLEDTGHQLRMYRVGPHNLTGDPNQGANLGGGQLAYFVPGGHIHKTDVVLLVRLGVASLYCVVGHCLAQEGVQPGSNRG